MCVSRSCIKWSHAYPAPVDGATPPMDLKAGQTSSKNVNGLWVDKGNRLRTIRNGCVVKEQVIGGCMHACIFLLYFASVHAWKLAVLCVCVALNNEDVMRGAHECVCANELSCS